MTRDKKTNHRSPEDRFYAILYGTVGIGLVIYSLAVFGFQVFFWLKNGFWVEVKLLYLFVVPHELLGPSPTPLLLVPAWFQGVFPWIHSPNSWFGFHKAVHILLDELPVSAFSLLLGVWLIVKVTDD